MTAATSRSRDFMATSGTHSPTSSRAHWPIFNPVALQAFSSRQVDLRCHAANAPTVYRRNEATEPERGCRPIGTRAPDPSRFGGRREAAARSVSHEIHEPIRTQAVRVSRGSRPVPRACFAGPPAEHRASLRAFSVPRLLCVNVPFQRGARIYSEIKIAAACTIDRAIARRTCRSPRTRGASVSPTNRRSTASARAPARRRARTPASCRRTRWRRTRRSASGS